MKRRSLLKGILAAIASPLATKGDLSVLKAENTPKKPTHSHPDDVAFFEAQKQTFDSIILGDTDTLMFGDAADCDINIKWDAVNLTIV